MSHLKILLTIGPAVLCGAAVVAEPPVTIAAPSATMTTTDSIALKPTPELPASRNPKSAEEYFHRAMVLLNRDDPKAAIADLNQVITLDPYDSRAFANRALAWAQVSDWARAQEDADRALSLDGSTSVAFDVRAVMSEHLGDHAAAIAAFTRAIELDTGDRYAHMQRARSYQSIGRFDAALADAEWALAADSQGAIELIADILVDAGRPDEAVARTESAVAADPRNARLLAAEAKLQQRLGRTDAAIVAFNALIKVEPSIDAYLARAELLTPSNRPAALADILAARAINAQSGDVMRIHAWFLGEGQDFAGALALLDAALKSQPGDIGLLGSRAYIHSRMGLIEAALDDLETAFRYHPLDASLSEALCFAMARTLHRMQQALPYCDASLAADPFRVRSREVRGLLFLQLGRFREAIDENNEVLRVKPLGAEALYGRGFAEMRVGERPAGLADIASAKARSADIEAMFSDFGLQPDVKR